LLGADPYIAATTVGQATTRVVQFARVPVVQFAQVDPEVADPEAAGVVAVEAVAAGVVEVAEVEVDAEAD